MRVTQEQRDTIWMCDTVIYFYRYETAPHTLYMEACHVTQSSIGWEMSDTVFSKSRYRDTILGFSIHFCMELSGVTDLGGKASTVYMYSDCVVE